jgi:putative two-component system response regulator
MPAPPSCTIALPYSLPSRQLALTEPSWFGEFDDIRRSLRTSGGSVPHRIVLIVDDNPENLTVLGELFSGRHKVRAANSGESGLRLASLAPVPDLILLDIMMPDMNGYEVLERLRAAPETREVPVIFMTAMSATEDEQRGLVLGAVDYITKPLRPAIVLARVQTHLELKTARDRLKRDNASLEAEIARRMHENLMIQDVTIRALARLAETRDNETGNHCLRTQEYVHALARRLSSHPRFAGQLDDQMVALIAKSAPLHDLGKVGIPDHVLLKPGKLTPDEWEIMKTHAKVGADAIDRAMADMRQPVKFLECAKQIAMHHHERWDGSGYPDGLAGDAIPLAARLMALADVFDALISRRVYKLPMPFDQVRETMTAQRGKHFDPDMLDLFIDGFDVYCDIARLHPDEDLPALRPAAGGTGVT